MSNHTLYEQDFYAWANQQAVLLRSRRLTEADIDNIAEEIESMGRSERHELVNRLTVLLMHLLKWRYQPVYRGASRRLTIEEQRNRLDDHLADNPSLKSALDASIVSAYRNAVLSAARETGLDTATFPAVCPWPFEQANARDFWPDAD